MCKSEKQYPYGSAGDSGVWFHARWRPDRRNSHRTAGVVVKEQVRWVPQEVDAETAARRATGGITPDKIPARFVLVPEIKVEKRNPHGKLIERTVFRNNETVHGLSVGIQQLVGRPDLTASQFAALINQLSKSPSLDGSEEVIQ